MIWLLRPEQIIADHQRECKLGSRGWWRREAWTPACGCRAVRGQAMQCNANWAGRSLLVAVVSPIRPYPVRAACGPHHPSLPHTPSSQPNHSSSSTNQVVDIARHTSIWLTYMVNGDGKSPPSPGFHIRSRGYRLPASHEIFKHSTVTVWRDEFKVHHTHTSTHVLHLTPRLLNNYLTH